MSEKVWTVGEILAVTADFLGKREPSSPRLDAELLLTMVLDLKRVQLYINFERVLNSSELTAYRELVKRRSNHEPVAYIMGHKEFYKLDFKVTPATLIPRPETEHLVDEALRILKLCQNPEPKACDIGTGSGAIAIALAKNHQTVLIEASDISAKALEVAILNANTHEVSQRINFTQGDLASPFAGERFDLICANLPYIPSGNLSDLDLTVANFEPTLALDGGPDGLNLISRLINKAPDLLAPGGHILMEIWPDTLTNVSSLANAAGLTVLDPIKDYSNKSRIFVGRA
ncbi:MAG: peptide chain release factor N(5)-glutamine methyltransferase [Deltaproteobacteria bacterium]|jgi:release factor glutamine methyltransferase|nr:peptide chain release factor N(5)-glutamine methyltransferase [Deltaproteobacteria bacterium]